MLMISRKLLASTAAQESEFCQVFQDSFVNNIFAVRTRWRVVAGRPQFLAVPRS
jgi:hypothetical protein